MLRKGDSPLIRLGIHSSIESYLSCIHTKSIGGVMRQIWLGNHYLLLYAVSFSSLLTGCVYSDANLRTTQSAFATQIEAARKIPITKHEPVGCTYLATIQIPSFTPASTPPPENIIPLQTWDDLFLAFRLGTIQKGGNYTVLDSYGWSNRWWKSGFARAFHCPTNNSK